MEKDRALGIFGDMRGGFRAAYTLISRGRLRAQMGRFEEAVTDVTEARAKVEKLEGKQTQLRARLLLSSAEIASYQTHWPEALNCSTGSVVQRGNHREYRSPKCCRVGDDSYGAVQPGIALCRHAIRDSEEKSQPYVAARGKLELAEALWANQRAAGSQSFAQEALAFFEPRRNWEAVWRCHRVLAEDEHSRFARAALEEGKRLWPENVMGPYLRRPDIQKLALP